MLVYILMLTKIRDRRWLQHEPSNSKVHGHVDSQLHNLITPSLLSVVCSFASEAGYEQCLDMLKGYLSPSNHFVPKDIHCFLHKLIVNV